MIDEKRFVEILTRNDLVHVQGYISCAKVLFEYNNGQLLQLLEYPILLFKEIYRLSQMISTFHDIKTFIDTFLSNCSDEEFHEFFSDYVGSTRTILLDSYKSFLVYPKSLDQENLACPTTVTISKIEPTSPTWSDLQNNWKVVENLFLAPFLNGELSDKMSFQFIMIYTQLNICVHNSWLTVQNVKPPNSDQANYIDRVNKRVVFNNFDHNKNDCFDKDFIDVLLTDKQLRVLTFIHERFNRDGLNPYLCGCTKNSCLPRKTKDLINAFKDLLEIQILMEPLRNAYANHLLQTYRDMLILGDIQDVLSKASVVIS